MFVEEKVSEEKADFFYAKRNTSERQLAFIFYPPGSEPGCIQRFKCKKKPEL